MLRTTLSLIVLLFACTSAFAQSVPPLMNYQGHLTNATGQPLATGQYTLTFNVYNVPTAGTAVWGPQAIVADVIDGYFNVVLSTDSTGGDSITTAFAAQPRYFGVRVGAATEILPRQQVLSTPYAVNSANGVPIGTVLIYSAGTLPPGYLKCDGARVAIADYPALYSVIGDTFADGTPPQAGTFLLPDLRGRFPIGTGSGENPALTNRILGQKSGAETVSLTTQELPNHTHGYSYQTSTGSFGVDFQYPTSDGVTGTSIRSRTTTAAGGGDPFSITDPALGMVYMIKY